MKRNTTLSKPYSSITDAASYLSQIHGESYRDSDIFVAAKQCKLQLCFVFDGELGIFQDPYGNGELEFTEESFNFSGYLGINTEDIKIDGDITAVRVNVIKAFDASDEVPELQKDYYYYCECTVPDGKGKQQPHLIKIKEDSIFISREGLLKYSDSLNDTVTSPKSPKSLSTTERNTLYKIVLGMAMAKYDYKPYASKNTATGTNAGSIYADLQERDLEVSNDTIKRLLDSAKENLL